MKISTKGRYALRALMYLTKNEDRQEPITMGEISEAEGISVKYLELIVRMMVSFGLVKTVKGKNGGILLGKKSDEIDFSEILEATEGPLSLVACVDNPATCDRNKSCDARGIWVDYSKVIYDIFSNVTLRELTDKYCGENKQGVK